MFKIEMFSHKLFKFIEMLTQSKLSFYSNCTLFLNVQEILIPETWTSNQIWLTYLLGSSKDSYVKKELFLVEHFYWYNFCSF